MFAPHLVPLDDVGLDEGLDLELGIQSEEMWVS